MTLLPPLVRPGFLCDVHPVLTRHLIFPGATRSDAATELLYARQSVVAHAKAFNLQAIDIVRINYKDMEGLQREAAEGAAMGFTGKQIIHPLQVTKLPFIRSNSHPFSSQPSSGRRRWCRALSHPRMHRLTAHAAS
jgi:hypothetical protein